MKSGSGASGNATYDSVLLRFRERQIKSELEGSAELVNAAGFARRRKVVGGSTSR